MPLCSIIIPVYNRAAITQQCLNALFTDRPQSVSFEIVVVDDGSTDRTTEMLKAYDSPVRVLSLQKNSGFSTACNEGAKAATGQLLVFLNNDTIPEPGWLDSLVRYADEHPRADIIGSKLLFPNDTVQHAGVVICQDHLPRHIYSGFPADHPAVNKSRRFQIVTAACAMFRRAAFERANGFDTAFVNGYEDVDLCLRLGQQGSEIHYCHESVLYHFESVSEGRFQHLTRNDRLFRERWIQRVVPDDLHYYVEDGLINIQYSALQPYHVQISPDLATVEVEGRKERSDELLQLRAQQIFELLRQNIALRADSVGTPLAATAVRAISPPTTANTNDRIQLVSKGRVVTPRTSTKASELISILMPTKNGSHQLRTSLPRIVSQQVDRPFEIIAVDSGSEDDTVELLREYGATIIRIDPESYNHGTTRNLAARYADGSTLVFINQGTLPLDETWLQNLVNSVAGDPLVAGACSRVVPRDDADILNRRDVLRDLSAARERIVKNIGSRDEYERLSDHQLRVLVNFHTVSAAIRADVFQRIPFRKVTTIGEDILWAKEVLEAGYKIVHEPSSAIYHSHNYSYFDLLLRNVDDGRANMEIVGRQLSAQDVTPTIYALVTDDWRYLERECDLSPQQMDYWRFTSVMRRSAQIIGQWIGVHHAELPEDLVSYLSLTGRIKAGMANSGFEDLKI